MEQANLMILITSALFGLCCGSFYNVCIYRLPREGLHLGRPLYSFCPHCFTTLQWYENIPLLSYLIQRGQCRHCLVWISPRYPLVEALTSFSFAYIAWRFAQFPHPQWGIFGVYLLFISALIICSFIDLDLRIIPDEIDKPGMVLAPILALLVPGIMPREDLIPLFFTPPSFLSPLACRAFLTSVAGVAAGAGVIYVVGVVGKAIFQKEAMGFGDVKYMGMIGGILGYKSVVMAFLLACFFGALVGIVKKIFTKDPYLAFGPYLTIGALGMLFYRNEIFRFVFTEYPRWLKKVM